LNFDDAGNPLPLANHNLMVWDTCHRHYHFEHFTTFSLAAPLPATGGIQKRGFCIQTVIRVANAEWSPLATPFGGCGFQGIVQGWSDIYNVGIPCQWVDVTGVDTSSGPVTGNLVSFVNPDNFLCEGELQTDAQGNQLWTPTGQTATNGQSIDKQACTEPAGVLNNNQHATPLTVPDRGQGTITQSCPRPQQQIGPTKDCEFDIQLSNQMKSCTAGDRVRLQCRLPTANSKPHVVRICESSISLNSGTACRYTEPYILANEIILSTAWQDVNFDCPTARDAIEVGGRYSIYSSPLLGTDPHKNVQCTS